MPPSQYISLLLSFLAASHQHPPQSLEAATCTACQGVRGWHVYIMRNARRVFLTMAVQTLQPARPTVTSLCLPRLAPSIRLYSSIGVGHTPKASRKQVTVTTDDGRVHWQDLTVREKAARTTQQTFNFGIVLAGFFGTVCETYLTKCTC